MSGDVQPRKRKDKRRKKDVTPEFTPQKVKSPGYEDSAGEDASSNLTSDETIHVHKDGVTGGNICAKIIFFGLMGALVVVIGLIIVEYRGSSDVDMPLEDSRFADLLQGWVDDTPPADDHGEPEESSEHDDHDEHDDEHSDEGGGDHEEEEHDEASTEHEEEEEAEESAEQSAEQSQELSEEEEQEEEEEDLPEESEEEEEEEEEESEELEGIPGVLDSAEQGASEEEQEEESEEQGGDEEEAKRKRSRDKSTPLVSKVATDPKLSRSTTEPQVIKKDVKRDLKHEDTMQESSSTVRGAGSAAMPPGKVAESIHKPAVDVPQIIPTPSKAQGTSGKHAQEAQQLPTSKPPAKVKPSAESSKLHPTIKPEPVKQAPPIQPTAKQVPVTEASPSRPIVTSSPQPATPKQAPPTQSPVKKAPVTQAPPIQPKPAPVMQPPHERPVVIPTPQLAPAKQSPTIELKPAQVKRASPTEPTVKPVSASHVSPSTPAPVRQSPPSEPPTKPAPVKEAFPSEPTKKPAPVKQASPSEPTPKPTPVKQAPPSEPTKKPAPVKQASPSEPTRKPAPVKQASPSEPTPKPAPVKQASPSEPTKKPAPVKQASPSEPTPKPAPVKEASLDKLTAKPTPQPVPIGRAAPVGEPVKSIPATNSPNNLKPNVAKSEPSEPRVQHEKQNIGKTPPSPSSHKDEELDDDAEEEENELEEEELEEEGEEEEEDDAQGADEEEEEEEEEEPEPSGAKQQESSPEESEGEEESDDEQPPVLTPVAKPKSSGAQEQQQEAAQESPQQIEPEETAREQLDVMEEEAEPHLELDEAELRLEDSPVDALRLFETMAEKHPNSVRVRYGKARCLDKMADMRHSNSLLGYAIDAYLSVLELKLRVPDDTYVTVANRCIDRMRFRGHHMKAVAVHRDLIERFPDNADHRNQLAVTYLLINRIDDSRRVLMETLQRWPQDGLALVHLGFILKTTDDNLSEAIDHLQRGIDSGAPGTVDGRFYFQLGDALMRLGRGDEALQVYEQGVVSGLFRSKYQRSLYNVDRLKAQPWWTPQETTYSEHFKRFTDNWKVIRDEGLAALVIRNKELFKDEAESLRETGDWKQFELFARGRKVSGNCNLTPITCGLIDEFPAAKDCRRGQVKFSVMEPGTHVWPHCGPTNCRLRAHLGLQVPAHTYIRVAHDTRNWREGELLVFDDSFEHEVWHNGTETRLVLIVDVWHPELTEQERKSLPAI